MGFISKHTTNFPKHFPPKTTTKKGVSLYQVEKKNPPLGRVKIYYLLRNINFSSTTRLVKSLKLIIF